MKKVLVLLLISVLFISCKDDDDEWRAARVNYEASVPVSPNGIIRNNFDIGSEWVEIAGNQRFDYIDDFRYIGGGYINIYGGPYIRSLTLSLEKSNIGLIVDVNSNNGGILRDSDPKVRNFLAAIVELIRLDGYARVYIDGNADPATIIEMDFRIEMDAYVVY